MKESMKKPIYETKDLMLAASLLALDIGLLEARRNGNRLTFCFDDTDNQCSNAEKLWWQGELMVPANRFAEAVRRLKSLVHRRVPY